MIRQLRFTLMCGACTFISSCSLYAQDIERLLEKNRMKIGGSFNANQNLYFQNGGTNRRDPYNLYLSGRVVASYGGLSVPLSFQYSLNPKTRRKKGS